MHRSQFVRVDSPLSGAQMMVCRRTAEVVKKGRLYFSRPGSLAAVYTEPEKITAVLSGNRMVAYYPASKSADLLIVPLVTNLLDIFAVGKASEISKVLYKIAWSNPQRPDALSVDFGLKAALPFEPTLTSIRVDFSKKTYLPARTTVVGSTGNHIVWEFTQTDPKSKFDTSIFDFGPPEDTHVNSLPDLHELFSAILEDPKHK